jgi:hypothetical protein
MQARVSWLVNVLVAGVVAAVPSRGSAQSASVQAQSLFDEGRKQMKAGKLAEACAAFEASQKLDPAITTLLNLAECREQRGQLATAWGTFVDANRMARGASDDKLAKVANTHAHKLEPRLSRLTISVPADHQVPGLAVLRGKDPVDPVSWSHALPIDGGSYTLTARAPGREPWSVTRTIKNEGDSVTIEIPRLAELKPGASPVVVAHAPPAAPPPAVTAHAPPAASPPAASPPSVSSAPLKAAPPAIASPDPSGAPRGDRPSNSSVPERTARPASPPPVASRDGGSPGEAPSVALGASAEPGPSDQSQIGPSNLVPIALGGGALALGGIALGFHLSGNSLYDRAQNATVQADRDSLYHSANARRYVAEVTGVAALGCAGAAIYFYVRGRSERRPATAIAPVVSTDLAGFAVAGSW